MRHPELKRGTLTAYILLLLGILTIMIMLRNCSGATWHTNDQRATGDTINVAIEISPIGLSTRADTLSGFYYDMVRELARRHSRPLKIDGFTHLESALDRLDEGRYDVVIGDIPANSIIRQRFLATDPVLIDRQVLVQLADSAGNLRYPTQFDLTGDTIHVPCHTPFKTRLQHLTRELGDTIYIDESNEYGAEQLIIMVAIGELPNAVVNRRLAEIMKADYPRLDSSVEISLNQFQSWLTNRADSALCDTLNAWIAGFHGSDLERELTSRYLDR